MVSEKITIRAKTGLHARPASQLVGLMKGTSSNFVIRSGTKSAHGNSIISILALGLKYGSEAIIEASGEDENEALLSVIRFMDALAE